VEKHLTAQSATAPVAGIIGLGALRSDASMSGNSKQRRQFRKFLGRTLGKQAAAETLQRNPKPETSDERRHKHAGLVYLRASGTVGALLGIGLTVSSILFWWGAGFLYAALAIG
jgi:hypothetical protein